MQSLTFVALGSMLHDYGGGARSRPRLGGGRCSGAARSASAQTSAGRLGRSSTGLFGGEARRLHHLPLHTPLCRL